MTRSCPYCGNNPVPHLVFKFNESLNILLTPLRQKLLYNGLTDLMKKHGWDQSLARFFLAFGEKIKILRRQSSEAECEVPRAKVLWQEAERRQIEMNELLLFGRPFDVYVAEKKYPSSFIFHPLPSKIKDKRLKIIFSGLPRPAGYNNKWLDLMDDKWLFKKKLMENNLPAPRGESCSSFSQAVKIFRKVQDNRPTSDFRSSDLSPIALAKGDPPINPIPLIVKPRAGSRGRHSTTFVYKQADLRRAFKIAKQLCYWVMVEEQLFGPVYRATVVNFELCGVLRGDPPQVVGDGVSTVVELIKNKNSNKNNQVKNINIDAAMELFLSRQNLKSSSVAANGQFINLSEKIGVNYGGSSSEDFEICHQDNRELFVRAAGVLGDPLVGFDFIIPDIAKSWKTQKCGFIEVNSLPFINLHHDPLRGQPRNVAAKVWDMVKF